MISLQFVTLSGVEGPTQNSLRPFAAARDFKNKLPIRAFAGEFP